MALTENGDGIDVEVTVKNTGDRDGKCAVQLYYTPPYTSGGIEKAEVNLIAVGKVDVPKGGSKSITLSFDKEDMESYDYKKTKTENGGYVLEKGEYVISLRSDSHTVIASDTVTVGSDVVYEGGNKRGQRRDRGGQQIRRRVHDDAGYEDGGLCAQFQQSRLRGYFPDRARRRDCRTPRWKSRGSRTAARR